MDERSEIGLVGLGVMGSAIGRRLLDTGHPLRVHDVRTEAMEAFAADGAGTAATPQDLADCAAVVLSLNTTALVEEVVFGPHGVLAQDERPVKISDGMSFLCCQISPAVFRSPSCCVRLIVSAAGTISGMGSQASDASVFVSR
jgi:hypothetical protein